MAERSYLSIGQVVNLLRGTYPDLSNSKIRFLEDEGLITPHRTPKGYRQYSMDDVERLEVILHLQKTRYMPLNVIKQRQLDATNWTGLLATAQHDGDLDLVSAIQEAHNMALRTCTGWFKNSSRRPCFASLW